MPETFSTAPAGPTGSVEAVDVFVGEALARAQVALYRGYLHEVNNTLAGVGTLAEAMKGSPAATMDANLELISSTMSRAIVLEKRLRATTNAPMSVVQMEVTEFITPYKEILELMLPRSVKIAWQISPAKLEASPQRLLNIMMVAFTLARESATSAFTVSVGAGISFGFGPLSPSSDAAVVERLSRALEAMSVCAGFAFSKTGDEVRLSWANKQGL